MAASTFERALALVLKHEGGYVDHPRDPGGATNLGVTIGTLSAHLGRPATKAEVRALTPASVRPLYKARYWDAVSGDELPAGLDYAVFDLAVNSGPARAARLLQRALGCTEDGAIGPSTLAACRPDPPRAVRDLSRARLAFLHALPTWSTFGRGWARRVEEVERAALDLARADPGPDHHATQPAGAPGPGAVLSSRPEKPMTTIPDILGRVVTDAIATAAANPSVPLQPAKADAVASAVVRSINRDPRAARIAVSDPKPWYRSSTIWGVILSSVLKVVGLFVPWVDPAWANTIVQYAPLLISFAGDGMAVFGRARATQPLA